MVQVVAYNKSVGRRANDPSSGENAGHQWKHEQEIQLITYLYGNLYLKEGKMEDSKECVLKIL